MSHISDWSSDVGASDLLNLEPAEPIFVRHAIIMNVMMLIDIKAVVFACFGQCDVRGDVEVVRLHIGEHHVAIFGGGKSENWHKIGRASCREQVGQYV